MFILDCYFLISTIFEQLTILKHTNLYVLLILRYVYFNPKLLVIDEPDLVSLSSGSEYEDTSYSVTETLESETTNVNCVDEKGVGEDTTVPVSKAPITTEPVTNFDKPQSEVGDSSLNCIPNFAEDNPNKSAESVPDTTGSEPQGLDESIEPDTLVENVTEDNSSVPRHDSHMLVDLLTPMMKIQILVILQVQ